MFVFQSYNKDKLIILLKKNFKNKSIKYNIWVNYVKGKIMIEFCCDGYKI